MKRIRLHIITLCASGLATGAQAQQEDFIGQAAVYGLYAINPSWEASLGAQALFNQNIAELWSAMGDAGIQYRITRHWTTGLHYRLIRFRETDNRYSTRQLFFHTLTYADGHNDFSWSVRSRTQQLVFGDLFDDAPRGPRWYNRMRLRLAYRFDYYWSIYSSAELFLPLNRPGPVVPDQWRQNNGITYTFNDHVRIDLSFSSQFQVNRRGNDSRFGMLTNLYFSL